jgi:hypothetical protein
MLVPQHEDNSCSISAIRRCPRSTYPRMTRSMSSFEIYDLKIIPWADVHVHARFGERNQSLKWFISNHSVPK